MPSQYFQIIRPPEAAPLSAEDIRSLLWQSRKDAEWEVREVLDNKPLYPENQEQSPEYEQWKGNPYAHEDFKTGRGFPPRTR